VILSALVDRPPLAHAHRRHQRGVEDRDREDEDRQHQRGDRRLGHLPAGREAEGAEREAEHLAARVAHEDERGLAGTEVEEQEAEAGEAEAEREHEQQPLLVDGDGVDREEDGRDQRERPGQAVHVVEQVEGVGHPHEPEQADDPGEDVVGDDLDREAGGERDRSRAELGGELHRCGQRVDVVDQPDREEQCGAAEDAEQLPMGVHAAGGDRGGDPGCEAQEDPDAPEGRGDVLAPPLACRVGDEPSRERRVEERPDHERGHGQGDRCCSGTHAGHGNPAVLGIGTEILTG
jgi:hypothetical protein